MRVTIGLNANDWGINTVHDSAYKLKNCVGESLNFFRVKSLNRISVKYNYRPDAVKKVHNCTGFKLNTPFRDFKYKKETLIVWPFFFINKEEIASTTMSRHQAAWLSIGAHHQATPGSPFSAGCCSVLMSYHLGTWGHLHWSCSLLMSSSSAELTAEQKLFFCLSDHRIC